MKTSFSVVVPTHNRPGKLQNLLQSIRQVKPPGLTEVVVVDDSDSPLDLTGSFSDIGVRHLKSSKRLFMSASKNIGWKAASSDLIYFIDDDNVVEDSTFAPVMQVLQGNDRLGAVMPGVVYKAAPEFVWVYAAPFLNSRHQMNLVGRNKRRDPGLEKALLKTDALPNASLVTREALEDVDGFDNLLVVNSSLDFAQRLKANGWRVCACPWALTRHDVELPGRVGWWATHGSADPERVRYELRDWFLLSKRLHAEARLFRAAYSAESLKFVLPNLLAYMTRSSQRRELIGSVATGYAEGLRLAGTQQESYFLRNT